MNKKTIIKIVSSCFSAGILACPAITSSINTNDTSVNKKDIVLNDTIDNTVKNDDPKTSNSRVNYLSEIISVAANRVIELVEGNVEATGTINLCLVKEYQQDNMTFKYAYHMVGNNNLVTNENCTYKIIPSIDIEGYGEYEITRITDQVFGQTTKGKIIISDTLTHIYNGFNNSGVNEIDFSQAKSLKIIGERSFSGCLNLTSIDFSNATKLEKIEYSAFSYCNAITSINFTGATSLESIEYEAFKGCSGLGSLEDGLKINCPSLKYLGEGVFYESNLKKIDLFSTSIVEIGADCFYGSEELTKVILPNTLQRIYQEAFACCTKLTTVNLNECENLYRIDGGVFRECDLQPAIIFPKKLQQIGNNTFSGNINLQNIDFTNCTKLKKIEPYAFSGCNKLSGKLWIPSSVRSIGACAFGSRTTKDVNFSDIYFNWTKSELISLDDKIDLSINWHPEIATGEAGTKIHVLDNTAQYYYGIDNFFDKIDILDVWKPWIQPSDLLQGEKPYSHETIRVLAKDILSEQNIQGEATLDVYTDENSNESYILTSLLITSDTNIPTITINDSYQGKKITAISSKCVGVSEFVEKLTLPSDLLFIGKEAFNIYNPGHFSCDFVDFSRCSKLEKIGECAFNNCDINAANINKATSLRTIEYRAFFNSDCEGIKYFDPYEPTKLDLSNLHNLKSIEAGSFWGCFSLKNEDNELMDLILPDNIEYIGASCFSRDLDTHPYESKIKRIDMTNSKSLKKIGTRAFYICQNLETIVDSTRSEEVVGLPEEIQEIGDNAFSYTKLTGKLIVPKNITSINDYCFEKCNLTDIDFSLAKNLKYIGDGAFNRNYSLKSINLEKATSLKQIGTTIKKDYSYVFGGCKSLTGTLGIPNSVNYINNFTFSAVSDADGPTFNSVNLYWTTSHLSLSKTEDNSITLNENWYPKLTTDAKVNIVDGTENLYTDLTNFPQEWINRFPTSDKLYAGIKFIGEYKLENISTSAIKEFTRSYANIVTDNIKYIDSNGTIDDSVTPNLNDFSYSLEAENGTDLSSLGIIIDSNGVISIKSKRTWKGNIRIVIKESKYGYILKTDYFYCKISSIWTLLPLILGITLGCILLIGIIVLLIKRRKNKK